MVYIHQVGKWTNTEIQLFVLKINKLKSIRFYMAFAFLWKKLTRIRSINLKSTFDALFAYKSIKMKLKNDIIILRITQWSTEVLQNLFFSTKQRLQQKKKWESCIHEFQKALIDKKSYDTITCQWIQFNMINE